MTRQRMVRRKVVHSGLRQTALQIQFPEREAISSQMWPGGYPQGYGQPPYGSAWPGYQTGPHPFGGAGPPPGYQPPPHPFGGAGPPPGYQPIPGGFAPEQYPQPQAQASGGPSAAAAPKAGAKQGQSKPAETSGTGRQVVFSDDHSKLSTAFRSLGCQWRHEKNRVTPRKFRQSLLAACDPLEWSMARTSQFTEDQIDQLLYCLSSVRPDTRVQDFGAATKGELRDQILAQHQRVLRQNPQRLQMLAEDLENLPQLVLRLGYPPDLFSPALYSKYQEALAARRLDSDGGQQLPPAPRQPQIPTSPAALPATPPAPRQPMIVDGAVGSPAFPKATMSPLWGAGTLAPQEQVEHRQASEMLAEPAPKRPRAEKRATDAPAAAAAPGLAVALNLPAFNIANLKGRGRSSQASSTTAGPGANAPATGQMHDVGSGDDDDEKPLCRGDSTPEPDELD